MPLSRRALLPLLRIATVPGIGPTRLRRLLDHFGSAERALADPDFARELPGMGPAVVRGLREAAGPGGTARAETLLARLDRIEAVVITPDDEAYPAGLDDLRDAPFVLYAAGRLELLTERRGFGAVGTRQPTPYGRDAARALCGEMARRGFTVVSGMARGIDAASHRASLDAGAGTVGVLGTGIDRIYPPENRDLFERARREGLLLTEFPPGEDPRAGNFPRRNRLIAALSEGVLVVEMSLKSGAQHTVDYALELGREVFAVPGPIGSEVSQGTNQLIRDGARLITRVEDILEELRTGAPVIAAADDDLPAHPEKTSPAAVPDDLPAEERAVLGAMGPAPRHVDHLTADAGLDPSRTLAALLGLELAGLIESLPGKHFRRV